MQTSLIILLFGCTGLALLGYYIGFVRPPEALTWLSKSTFVVMTFMLIPVLLFVLYQQAGAIRRFEDTGFRAHPAIVESVGIALGTGTNPVWVFEVDATAESVLAFYRNAANVGDWALVEDHQMMLLYGSDQQMMNISTTEEGRRSHLILMLRADGPPDTP